MRKAAFLMPAIMLIAAPAHAQLPEPVRAIIEAAIATGDTDKVATVIELARTTNPADGAEIDAIFAEFSARQAALSASAAQAEQRAIAQSSLFERWSGEGQIGAFQSSGNTDSVGVSAAVKLQREGIDWTHKLRANADYQRTGGLTSREQFLAAYEPRYALSPRLFAFGLAQFERDRRQGYSARYALSGGVGYKVIDNASMVLSIKAGPAYRRTEFVDGASESRIAGLLGVDLDWQIADDIKLTQDTNAVAEGGGEALLFVSSDNTSLNAITGVELGISNDLSARLSYAVEYDSNPPPGAVSTDTMTRFTLVYGF